MRQVTFIVILFAFSFWTCRKPTADSSSTSEDYSTAEGNFSTIWDNISQEYTNVEQGVFKSAKTQMNNSCVTVTGVKSADSSYFKFVTIDYGSTNCVGIDGRERRGKIIIDANGLFDSIGVVINVSFVDFYQNDNRIEGTETITRLAAQKFNIIISNGRITNPDGEEIRWESDRTYEQITPVVNTLCDEVWKVTGNDSGINRNGRKFIIEITEPLIKESCCRWIAEGVVVVTPEFIEPRTVDFGDGACDAVATVKIKKTTFTIGLP